MKDSATTSKGHLQPPVDERLIAANRFLTDEDDIRYPNFKRRLQDIIDYVEHIEAHNLHCNIGLLNDVKCKMRVHQECYDGRVDSLSTEILCLSDTHVTQPISGPVKESSPSTVPEESSITGSYQQARTNQSLSGNIQRGRDVKLGRSMLEDPEQDSIDIDREKNLCRVENNISILSLHDPAMIPSRLDPKAGPLASQYGAEEQRPLSPESIPFGSEVQTDRTLLPDYLLARQAEINRLLKERAINDIDSARLDKLLRFHEPRKLKKLYNIWQCAKDDTSQQAVVAAAKSSYVVARDNWLIEIRQNGVRLAQGQGSFRVNQEGILYVPGPQSVTIDQHAYARHAQIRLDILLAQVRYHKGYEYIRSGSKAQEVQLQLAQTLLPFATERLRCHRPKYFAQADNSNALLIEWADWVNYLAYAEPQIVILRPGEMEIDDPSLLCVEWKPQTIQFSQSCTPISPATSNEDGLSAFHGLLQKKRDPRYAISESEMERSVDLIVFFHSKRKHNPQILRHLLGPTLSQTDDKIVNTTIDTTWPDDTAFCKIDELIVKFSKQVIPLRKEIASTVATGDRARTPATDALHKLNSQFLKDWWSWYCLFRVFSPW